MIIKEHQDYIDNTMFIHDYLEIFERGIYTLLIISLIKVVYNNYKIKKKISLISKGIFWIIVSFFMTFLIFSIINWQLSLV